MLAAALFGKGIYTSAEVAKFVGLSKRAFIEGVGKYVVSIFGDTEEDISTYTKESIK